MRNGVRVVNNEGLLAARLKKTSGKSASNPWVTSALDRLCSMHRLGTEVSLSKCNHSEAQAVGEQEGFVLVYDLDAQ